MKEILYTLSIYPRSIKSIYLQLKTEHVLRGGIKITFPFAAPVFPFISSHCVSQNFHRLHFRNYLHYIACSCESSLMKRVLDQGDMKTSMHYS
jgi:hypothetical protein